MANKSIGLLNIVFGADLRGFDRAMKKAQKNIKRFGNNLKKTGKTLTTTLTLPLAALGVQGVKAFDKQQKAIAQVEAGLKSTGNQVGITSEELQNMASDLQKTTLFGDEEILQGATAQLLTFTNIAGEQFIRTQQAALDLATRLDGDLKSASIMLGKALNDPVANLSALSRAGIQFSKEQKETVKALVETNRLADAQTIILNELEQQYGGSAEAAAAAGLGPIQQLGNVLSDISESIGEILLPLLQDLATFITDIAIKFDNLDPSIKRIIVGIGLLVGALGPALILFGQIAIAIAALSGPIGIAVVAISAIVTAIGWVLTSSSEMAIKVKNIFIAMANTIIDSVNDLIKVINLINPFKKLEPVKKLSFDISKNFDDITDSAKESGKEIQQTGTNIQGLTDDVDNLTTSTKQYSDAIEVLQTNFTYGFSPIEERFGDMVTWTADLRTQAEINAELLQQTLSETAKAMGETLKMGADNFKDFNKMVLSGVKQIINALIAEGVAAAIANALKNPKIAISPFLIPIIAGGAAGLANTAFNSLIPEFAEGGLVTGPTLGLIGEGSGTSAFNPEVISPLDKLMAMMGASRVDVTGRIQGDNIILVSDKATLSRERFI